MMLSDSFRRPASGYGKTDMQPILLDSSCVLSVLAPELYPDISGQIPKKTKARPYCQTDYLRNEFLGRWIITAIEIYMYARQAGQIHTAFATFADSFKPREVKAVLHWASIFVERNRVKIADDPVAQFGWELLRVARSYDKILDKRCPAVTECTRGRLEFEENPTTLDSLLCDFYTRFKEESGECHLKRGFNPETVTHASLRRISSADPSECEPKSRPALKKLQANIKHFMTPLLEGDCETIACWQIADVLIALEQPNTHVLYHTDHAFSALCPLLKKPHVQLPKKSLQKAKKEALSHAREAANESA